MAIARRSLTQTTAVTPFTGVTTSVTVPAGSDRILVVVVNIEGNAGGTGQVTSMAFGGVALTRLIQDTHADWASCEIWYLKAPAVSTADVVTAWTAGMHGKQACYVFDGVDQVATFRTAQLGQGGSGTSSSVTVPSVASGDYVLDGLTIDSAGHAAAVGANQTEEWDTNLTGCDGAGSTQAGADGGVMSWTWTTSAPFAHVATALIPAGGAQTIALGQATETDTAQAIAWSPKNRLLGQALETDTAQAFGRLKSRSLGQATETDTALAFGRLKTRTLGQAAEADTAQALAVGGAQTITLGQALETDTAGALGWSPKARLLGMAAELDTALALTPLGPVVVGFLFNVRRRHRGGAPGLP